MLRIIIFILTALFVKLAHAQENLIMKNDNILEKYIDRTNQRSCDSDPQTSFYKCSCKLSIHYPFFVKEDKKLGLKNINKFIKEYIDKYSNNIGKCNASGDDFGENKLAYVILYQDKKYLSIGIEKYFCCGEQGETHDYKIFNFDQDTGSLTNIDVFINSSNLSAVEDYILRDVKVYVDNLPEDFKVLTYTSDKGGNSKVVLEGKYAQYYFTEDCIAFKIRPDLLGFNIIDVKIPPNLIEPRYYPTKVLEDELDDNTNNILYNEKITEE